MLRILLIGCTCLSLLGCVGSRVDRLPKYTKFRDIKAAVEITGVFKNQGAPWSGPWHPLLSDVLFRGISFSEPPSEVRISSDALSVLRCEAMSHGKVLAVRDLVQGQDFRLVDGGVQIEEQWTEPVVSLAGVGVGTENFVIRLTDTGDAVLTRRGAGVGLMLFVVPMATIIEDDALFQRIKDGEPDATANPDSTE